MGKCKHETTHRMWWHLGRWVNWVDASARKLEWWAFGARHCVDCGVWLPLGPSNDTPREVQIEIRAAALVADPDDVAQFTQVEWAGYWDDETYSVGGGEPLRNFDVTAPDWQAGYLANDIDTHDVSITTHPEEQS